MARPQLPPAAASGNSVLLALLPPTARATALASGDALLACRRAGAPRPRQRPAPHNVPAAVTFARRDLTHGSIRVGASVALSHYLLDAAPAWRDGGFQAAIAGGRNPVVPIPAPAPAPAPVILFHATAMTDRHGRVLFADDIYRRDPELIRLPKAPPPRADAAQAAALRWEPPP